MLTARAEVDSLRAGASREGRGGRVEIPRGVLRPSDTSASRGRPLPRTAEAKGAR